MEDRMLGELPWLAPIGALVLTAMLAVILSLFVARGHQGRVGAFVAAGHLVAAGLVAWVWLDLGPSEVMEGTVMMDGLAQFPAELQIFLGTFDVFPAIAVIALIGLGVTAALFLLALQRAFLGEPGERWAGLRDLGPRELAALAPLIVLTVALGVYPRLALDLIDAGAWLAP